MDLNLQMKAYLITFSLFLFCCTAQAQSWVRENPVWHYDYWTIGWWGFVKIEQTGDTTIESHVCQKLKVTDHQFAWTNAQMNQLHHNEMNRPDRYTYELNDTVYYWNADHFDILYAFTTNVNDYWLIERGSEWYQCNDSSYTKVESIGSINLNGEQAILMELVDSTGGSFGMSIQNNWPVQINSRFGAMQEFLFPSVKNCDPNNFIEPYVFTFKCFQDDSLSYNPSGEDCEYLLTHLDLPDHFAGKLTVYPNPSSEWVLVETAWDEGDYEVFTFSGQSIASGKLNKGNMFMDVKHLSDGLYLVSLKSDAGVHVVERFTVKH